MSGPNRTYSFGQGDDGSLEAAAHGTNRGLASVPEDENQNRSQSLNREQSMRTNETATPGMDNLGPGAAGGGISGIALGIANSHDRLSGVEAIRSPEEPGINLPAERAFTTTGSDTPYIPAPPDVAAYGSSETLQYRYSYGSNIALGAAAAPAGQLTPAARLSNSNLSQRNSMYDSPYQGSGALGAGPYQRQSVYSSNDYPLVINPDDIVDDGDDDIEEAIAAKPKRLSKSARASQAAAFSVFAGKNNAGVTYDPVPGAGLVAEAGAGAEKSQWVKPKPAKGSKKRGWIVGLILAFIVIAATVGGAVGGTLGNKSNNSSNSDTNDSTNNANTDTSTNGDLDLNSAEIKALMNNPNLHKVFPGMDYTPWGVQYPLCLTYPPSQNNVTRDMAVLTQLTNNVRLYGTDCNQTEMVLHAIDKLQLTDMKLWLGVWIDISNDTTSTRQINQMYNIIESQNDTSIFNGAIIGNEVLYSGGNDITFAETTLTGYMQQVRTYFKQKGWNIPIATSDLGDNWNAELVNATDIVMANIHPFFGGVPAPQAANWTWTFFQEHDVELIQGTSKTAVISETGWPSAGGNDCGDGANCSNNSTGSVAGVSEMNQFLEDWVCQALENGTNYFWFEAFDEPWKVIYDTGNANWEDKWGLMDPARVLKPGLKIPDCGGKTAT